MHIKALLLLGALSLSLPTLPAADVRSAPRVFKIGPATQILVDGAEVSADKLKTGLHATVVADSFQDGFAASIDAHTVSAKGGAQLNGAIRPQTTWGQKDGAWVQVPNAPQPTVSSLAPAPTTAKYWVITAVSADSITIEYKQ